MIGWRPRYSVEKTPDRCAMCGTLLHGDVHLNNSACSNKKYGPPIDRHGATLYGACRTSSTLAQPPCMLRLHVAHLPAVLAPGMDVEQNTGSLRASSRRRRRRCSSTMAIQTVSGWRRVQNALGFATHALATRQIHGSSVSVSRQSARKQTKPL